jgi:hypothetical protein
MAEAQQNQLCMLGFAPLSANLQDLPSPSLHCRPCRHKIWNTSYAAWSGIRRPMPTATIRLSQSYCGADVSK